MSLIEFREVAFVHHTGVVALDGINVAIAKGEFVAIVGENGAGKTTLVRHINGLLKPTKGAVFVDGKDTRETSTASLARKVGIAFQNPDHQLFSESVEHEVAFALRNFGFSDELVSQRIDRALKFFSLDQYRKSSPLILSGGEKKRLTMASILAWDPEIVILDEPTVGQDAIQKEKLAEIIKMLNSTGKTIIVVSHDVEFLWPLQPRLLVMAGGRLTRDGPISVVMRESDLLAKARVMQPQLVRLHGALRSRPAEPFLALYDARKWIAGAQR
jgi:energy-coupling factor transport system ATP-binding protein